MSARLEGASRNGLGGILAVNARFFVAALSVLMAGLLASRPLGVGLDDDNYIEYFGSAGDILQNGLSSPIVLIFNEPLFLLVGLLTPTPEAALRVAIFLGAILAGVGVARLSRWSLVSLALYFVFPLSLVAHIDHIRQGLAIGYYFFFLACSTRVRWLRCLAPFIHSSFWVTMGIELISYFLLERRRVGGNTVWPSVAILVIGVVIAVVFSLLVIWVASGLGFRQVEQYDFERVDGSGLGLAFWIVTAPLVVLGSRSWVHFRFCAFLGFYLGGYFLSPVTARILTSGMPLLFSGGWRRPWVGLIQIAVLCLTLAMAVRTDFFWRLFAA